MRALLLLMLAVMSGCAVKPAAVDPSFAAVSVAVTGDTRSSADEYRRARQGYQTDPRYACSQPLYAAWFRGQGRTGATPLPCANRVPFAVQTPDEGIRVVWLDPARVSAVHLLFAGSSPSPASRFGHVALRLVVCPASAPDPQACDSNLSEHLVLGFQAHVDDFTLDLLKALGGEYQARLFASRFLDTYEQYAIGEFRELHSLPLRLSAPQRQQLVRDLAQIHWRFAGSYDFFTRNCATLLQQALRVSWDDYAGDRALADGFLRPDRLFAALRDSPLADGARLASPEQAERDGYYFSSTRSFYEQALAQLRQHLPGPGLDSLQAYTGIAPHARRAAFDDPDYVQRLKAAPRTLQAQLMLEEYALFSSQRLLSGYAADYLRRQDFASWAGALDATHAAVFNDCLVQPLRQRIGPPRRASGIPAEDDRFSEIPVAAEHCGTERSRLLLAEAMAAVSDDGSEAWQHLTSLARYRADTLDNILYLRQLRP